LNVNKRFSFWQGLPPPQYIYANMHFKCVALEPPNFEPGSWIGAGKAVIDYENEEFILTARPRKAEGGVRGYAANVYRSKDGERFELVSSISKEEVVEKSGLMIHSIEGTQLLKDPLTGKWHFYLSVDTGPEFVWGGVFWETLLMVAEDLKGPWESKGLVIRHDQSYDSCQSRDSSIDIVDGRWICLYRGHDYKRNYRMVLATSADGVKWKKHGPLRVDGKELNRFRMSGTTFAGASGPIFMGVSERNPIEAAVSGEAETSNVEHVFYDEWKVPHGMRKNDFVAYRIDYGNVNLETIFRAPWEARSRYEHKEYPLLGYSSLVYDPFRNRVMLYLEAIGLESKKMGLNETIERVLAYECPL